MLPPAMSWLLGYSKYVHSYMHPRLFHVYLLTLSYADSLCNGDKTAHQNSLHESRELPRDSGAGIRGCARVPPQRVRAVALPHIDGRGRAIVLVAYFNQSFFCFEAVAIYGTCGVWVQAAAQ